MPTITQAAANTAVVGDEAEDQLYRKVLKRILPLLLLCYVVAYLDRVNVGFAKLQMLDALGLSDSVYAVGASIFFWGYFLFEMPSNLLLHKYGARFWIARIMVTWGIVSSSLAFIRRWPVSFMSGQGRCSTSSVSCWASAKRDSSRASSCT